MQEMVYSKAIQKSPMSVSVSGTTDQKTYLKKFGGGFSPLSPPPGSAYGSDQGVEQADALDSASSKVTDQPVV